MELLGHACPQDYVLFWHLVYQQHMEHSCTGHLKANALYIAYEQKFEQI